MELHTTLQTCQADDICLLTDHNSLVLLARDAARPLAREFPQIREASEIDLAMLARLQLYDAWQEVHYDLETQEVPPGYTYRYDVHKRP